MFLFLNDILSRSMFRGLSPFALKTLESPFSIPNRIALSLEKLLLPFPCEHDVFFSLPHRPLPPVTPCKCASRELLMKLGSGGESGDYTDNPRYKEGSDILFKWQTVLKSIQLVLWQHWPREGDTYWTTILIGEYLNSMRILCFQLNQTKLITRYKKTTRRRPTTHGRHTLGTLFRRMD